MRRPAGRTWTARVRARGEVEDEVGPEHRDGVAQRCTVADVVLEQLDVAGDAIQVRRRSGAEVVDDQDGHPPSRQRLDHRRPDEPGAPGHDRALDSHAPPPCTCPHGGRGDQSRCARPDASPGSREVAVFSPTRCAVRSTKAHKDRLWPGKDPVGLRGSEGDRRSPPRRRRSLRGRCAHPEVVGAGRPRQLDRDARVAQRRGELRGSARRARNGRRRRGRCGTGERPGARTRPGWPGGRARGPREGRADQLRLAGVGGVGTGDGVGQRLRGERGEVGGAVPVDDARRPRPSDRRSPASPLVR